MILKFLWVTFGLLVTNLLGYKLNGNYICHSAIWREIQLSLLKPLGFFKNSKVAGRKLS
jgi:hypothetical protein